MRWIGLRRAWSSSSAVALLFSRNRRAIRWRTVGWAFALQLAFAFLVLYWEQGQGAPRERSRTGSRARSATPTRGPGFSSGGWPGRWTTLGEKLGLPIGGFIFAFKVLPIIIFICAFFSILYHFGIIQRLVQGMAWVMQKTMKVSGAEALCVAANVFIGQTEAPVLIAPYIARDDDLGAADDDDRRHGPRLGRRDARLRDDGGAAQVPDHGLGHGGARARS